MSSDSPPDCQEQVRRLNRQSDRLRQQGRFPEALEVARRSCDLAQQHLGEQHLLFATCLNKLAGLYGELGDYGRAEPLHLQTIEIVRGALGEQHPHFATCLNNLAVLYESMGDSQRAEPLCRRATEITRLALGEQHPSFATYLNNLAGIYQSMGAFARAEPLYRQALEIRRVALGEQHPSFATSLNGLGLLYDSMGEYEQAETLYSQALEIRRVALGEQHPSFAASLNNLAELYRSIGDYRRAEPLYLQATEVWRVALGEQHPDFATSLNNLAQLYKSVGDFARAEPLCRRATEIRRTALGERHRDYASSLNNLAALYQSMGVYGRAEPLYRQATQVLRVSLGEQHPHFATILNNLALLYHSLGDNKRAEPLYLQVAEILRAALGERHRDYASSLNNLAELYRTLGEYERAEPLLRQATEITRLALGERHPSFATSLNNLALLYNLIGDYGRAEELYRRATEILCAGLGEQHPDFAASLNNLSGLYIATDRASSALTLMEQAARINDGLIGQVFSIGSESQRTAVLKRRWRDLVGILSLVCGHLRHNPEAIKAALEIVLRRKAIGAEVSAAQRDAVLSDKYSHLQSHLCQWFTLRRLIARRTLAGPGAEGPQAHQRQLAEWHEQRERLEAELARQIPEMNLEQKLRVADRRAVALALPDGVTLVEFVRFSVLNFKAVPARGERRRRPDRYLAFVLRAGEPDDVQMIDLGEAEPIDRLIELFRTGVSNLPEARNMVRRPVTADSLLPEQAGQQLRAAVFDPLLAALGDCRRLLISADGGLTRLPFVVLPDAEGRLLMDAYRISYVNCGRDVLRFGASSGPPSAAVVVTDPDFDLAASAEVQPTTAAPAGRLARDMPRDRLHFGRLPGTRGEGQAIAALLGISPWQDTSALEGRLKRECRSPQILHLATHGFFLEDSKHDPNQERRDFGLSLGEGRLSGPLPENPLLRSGLALAGANTFLRGGSLPEEAEDGLLTAEDVSGLDLLATELVVLSACETGLGEVRTGEGVFGLQRAFTLAGAKTLVMSLWSVPDDATRELMEDFYRRILAGEGRADALRNAQLALRRKYPDPYSYCAILF